VRSYTRNARSTPRNGDDGDGERAGGAGEGVAPGGGVKVRLVE
jgi:hypothetical protein